MRVARIALVLVAAVCAASGGASCAESAGAPRDAAVGMDARARDAAGPGERDATAGEDAGEPGEDAGVAFEERAATNPVIAGDRPDPGVVRVVGADGRPAYYLTHTAGTGDFRLFRSFDLLRWEEQPTGLFGRGAAPGTSVRLNEDHYCALWAPQITELGPGSFMLHFTAQRFGAAQAPCPPYREDSGVYLAWSPRVEGPYAPLDHPWEPLPVGAQISTCAIRDSLPRSVLRAVDDCLGTFCHHVVRLDSDVFRDPADGRWWLAYAWYTNDPPRVDWERSNHGEHVNLVELDPADPFAVICDPGVAQIALANPHDAGMVARLAASCPRCGEMLSFTRGRRDETMVRSGSTWGVVEGPSLFRRGGYVYALVSGSAWDSAYYSVAWIAAPSVPELAIGSATRFEGRFLVPGAAQAFGHGSAVLGPDGERWYFVHHRLRHADCRDRGDCARDVWVSPIEFEDRGDGRGEAWIRARFPAEDPGVRVRVPVGTP